MSTTTDTLTRGKARRLMRKADDLESEADDLRIAGLDERADELEAGAETLREKVETWGREKRRRDLECRRERREARERQAAREREEEKKMARRRAAREWYRSWTQFRGGRPQPAEQVLATAEAAGHDPEDLGAGAVVRVKRLKDGVECLAFRGEYLRGEFRPVADLPGRLGA